MLTGWRRGGRKSGKKPKLEDVTGPQVRRQSNTSRQREKTCCLSESNELRDPGEEVWEKEGKTEASGGAREGVMDGISLEGQTRPVPPAWRSAEVVEADSFGVLEED